MEIQHVHRDRNEPRHGGEEALKNRIKYSELQKTVEFLNAKQSKLMAQMARKQKLRSGAPDKIQMSIFQEVTI